MLHIQLQKDLSSFKVFKNNLMMHLLSITSRSTYPISTVHVGEAISRVNLSLLQV